MNFVRAGSKWFALEHVAGLELLRHERLLHERRYPARTLLVMLAGGRQMTFTEPGEVDAVLRLLTVGLDLPPRGPDVVMAVIDLTPEAVAHDGADDGAPLDVLGGYARG